MRVHAIQGPFVEFFNPKMRRELEKKDEEIKRTTGKGGAPSGDEWTYLNGFSRVPVSFLTDQKYHLNNKFQLQLQNINVRKNKIL